MNKQTTTTNDSTTTFGCQSFGIPHIPSGADGVEPLVRMDYEAIISDLFHKCNEAFINAPQGREVRHGYFKLIVGDIAEAIASVIPCERSARSADPAEASRDGMARTQAAPIDHFCQSDTQRMEARKARKIHWQTFATKVDIADMGRTRQNGKVYEIRILKRNDQKHDTSFLCNVNGTTVIDGTFDGSAWMAKRMLESAMQALVNAKALRRRMQRLAAKRRAVILTPEEELADTIARQMENA